MIASSNKKARHAFAKTGLGHSLAVFVFHLIGGARKLTFKSAQE
jgi:hypothetical protein